MHDERGNSSITKTSSSSFAKASFVSSISTTGASDNIALDDPDFWTKVVGLASKEEEETIGHKKRKCAREITSYKEPSLNCFRINPDSDSDNEGGLKKKKVVKDPCAPEPVEWTDANLQRLLVSMVSRGYGNWEAIRRDTKLYWDKLHISHGCRLVLLQLLKWASLPAKSTAASTNANDDINDILEQSKEELAIQATASGIPSTATDQLDINYLTTFLIRSRACRLGLAAFNIGLNEKNEVAADGDKNSSIPNNVCEDDLISSFVRNIASDQSLADTYCSFDKICSEALHIRSEADIEPLIIENSESSASDESTSFLEIPTNFTSDSLKPIPQRDFSKIPIDSAVSLLNLLNLPDSFSSVQGDKAVKIRLTARAKISQIEDIFELRIASLIQQNFKSNICPFTAESKLIQTVKDSLPGIEYVTASEYPYVEDSEAGKVSVIMCSPLENLLAKSNSLATWNAANDYKLCRAVDQVFFSNNLAPRVTVFL